MRLLDLPPELLALVFIFLDWRDKLSLTRVCKEINAFLVHHAGLWKSISIHNYTKKVEQQAVEVLRIARDSTHHVSVTLEENLNFPRKASVYPTRRLLDQIVLCRNLRRLQIANFAVTRVQLVDLVSALNRLTHLSISLKWNLEKEDGNFCSYLNILRGLQCVILNELPYSYVKLLQQSWQCIGFKPSHIISITSVEPSRGMHLYRELPRLQKSMPDSSLFSIYKKRNCSLSSVTQTPMFVFGAHSQLVVTSTELGTLCLIVTSNLFDFASMTYRNIKSAIAFELVDVPVAPKNLEGSTALLLSLYSLDLSTQKLSMCCLDFIARHCPNLEELNLQGCGQSCDPSFLACTESFFISGIRSIGHSCPKLRSLNLFGICLEDAVEACHILSTMSCLECLCISHCVLVQPSLVLCRGHTPSPTMDTDAKRSISCSLASMNKLRALQVKPCVSHREELAVSLLASEQLLNLISQCVSLQYLKVNLTHRSHVMGLDNLLQSCRLLKSLYIQVHWKICIPDDLHIYANLHHLHLSCPQDEMSGRLVSALCNAKDVSHLYLNFRVVPENGPFALLQHLPKLVALEIVSLCIPCKRYASLKKEVIGYARSQGPPMLSSFKYIIGSSEVLSQVEHTALADLW